MKLAGCILAFNEERNIVECINSLRPHVDTLYLINMSSTDRTVELAQPLVDHIITLPNVPNFDSARNVMVDRCDADWIFFLDADERLPFRTGELVRQHLRDHGNDISAIMIPFRTQFCGKWIDYSGWWPGYTMPRVLKRGHFRFGSKLHSGVNVDGPQIRISPDPNLAIQHYSYLSVSHYFDKFNRYTTTESLQLAKNGFPLSWRTAVRAMVQDLWRYYEKNEGVKDGLHGFILAWLAGQYRLFSQLKLIDDPNYAKLVPSLEPPNNLEEVLGVIQHELGRMRAIESNEPFGIWYRSPIFDPSGYADEARVFLKALSGTERSIAVEEYRWNRQECEVLAADRKLLKIFTRTNPTIPSIKITNCIPTLVKPDPAAEVNILRTTFETDRLPDFWIEHLAGYDEIWVLAEHNRRSFIRGGVAPERLRVVPAFVDTDVYRPDGDRMDLPQVLTDRFVFLSIFDWQLRKGWDVLLSAYASEFQLSDNVGLLLKITRSNGQSVETVTDRADEVLETLGQSLAQRSDIVIWDSMLPQAELAKLYRSVKAFVLASRGEGWGRPYIEAMASGLPTIGTRGSGNEMFMNDENSFLVDTIEVPVSVEGFDETPPYEGHMWREPQVDQLRAKLRFVRDHYDDAKAIGSKAALDIQGHFSVSAGTAILDAAVRDVEAKHRPIVLPTPTEEQICVVHEGEFFAGHSFSNINEELVLSLTQDASIALSIDRRFGQPTHDEQCANRRKLAPYFGRTLPKQRQVTIRHAYPPNWSKPEMGLSIHIQPWEFGYLPREWIDALCNDVDEIWVPSQYVKDVYVRSGIPEHKVFVIPWGVNTAVYHPDAVPLFIPTNATFRFLFVGGSIPRKGFDILLAAFLAEFKSDEDVCLVIKDMGTDSFYRYGNCKTQIESALKSPDRPKIVYLNHEMTDGQRASLYTACHCLVLPYRGEGFGLPVLEAMACGLPVIVPRGGATDDFVDERVGIVLDSTVVETDHVERLVGPAQELSIQPDDLRKAMRAAFTERQRMRDLGQSARKRAEAMTWTATAARMVERIKFLVAEPTQPAESASTTESSPSTEIPTTTVRAPSPESIGPVPSAEHSSATDTPSGSIEPNRLPQPIDATVCIVTRNSERMIGPTLALAMPLARQIVVVDVGSTDRTRDVVAEYGYQVRTIDPQGDYSKAWNLALRKATSKWVIKLLPGEWISQSDFEVLRQILDATEDKVLGYACDVEQLGSKDIRILRNHAHVVFTNRLADDVMTSIQLLSGTVFSAKIAVQRLNDFRPMLDSTERLAALHADLVDRSGNPWLLWCLGQAHFEMGNYFHAECYLSDCATGARSSEFPRNQVIGLLIETYMRIDDPYRAQEWRQRLNEQGSGAT